MYADPKPPRRRLPTSAFLAAESGAVTLADAARRLGVNPGAIYNRRWRLRKAGQRVVPRRTGRPCKRRFHAATWGVEWPTRIPAKE